MSTTRIVALSCLFLIAICTGVQAAGVASGLPAPAVVWFGILGGALGTVQSFLPKVTR